MKLDFTIQLDSDWLRLVAYKHVLESIARSGGVSQWERDPDEAEPHEVAEAVLRAMGDWDEGS